MTLQSKIQIKFTEKQKKIITIRIRIQNEIKCNDIIFIDIS